MIICSTIIPTVHRHSLNRAVKSALGQDLKTGQHEIIVVNDSGNPLPDYDWLWSPRIRVVNTNRAESANDLTTLVIQVLNGSRFTKK